MANEKRTLVELSSFGVQVLSVSGRTVTGWIGRGLDAKEAVTEFLQAAEGSPFALVAPKQTAVARGEGDAAGASATLAAGLGGGDDLTTVVVDAATGKGVSGAGAWVAAGAPAAQIEEAKEQLAGLGVAAMGSGLSLAAHIGAVIACLQASGAGDRVAIWAPGESVSNLVIVSAAGVEKTITVQLGFPQVFEAVQVALGLKFKTAAQKLFANEGYDFSAASNKVGDKLAETLAGAVKEAGGAASLHVAGFSAAQSAWLTPALAGSLGLSPWAPDFAGWLSSKGWTVAGDVTLTACAAGVLGAAVQPDAWIVASAPAKAAPVKVAPAAAAVPVVVPAPKPVEPAVLAPGTVTASVPPSPAPTPAPAPKAPPAPAKVAAPAPAPAPAPAKPTAPAAKTPAPVAQAKPVAQSAPVAKPAPVPVPVSTISPAVAPAGKAPAMIGGVPVPFIISGVVLSLLVGAGVFFLRNKDDAPVAQAAPAAPPAVTPPADSANAPAKPASSLSDLLAPPPVPGLKPKPAAPPAPVATPATSSAATPVAKAGVAATPGRDSVPGMVAATDLIAEGRARFSNSLYEVLFFEGSDMFVVKRGGNTVFSHVFYQTTHAPISSQGIAVWKTLDRLIVAQTRVKRVDEPGTATFFLDQENHRARAEHEIVCRPDRIDVTTRLRPKDYVTNVQGKIFTYADFNWSSSLSPAGSRMKNDADSAYKTYTDGSTVRLVFLDGFYRLMADETYRAQTAMHAYFSANNQARAHFHGNDPEITYGPLRISVRFE